MSDLLNSSTFGDRVYERFPSKYKVDDKETNYSLKRYIQSASEGGFKPVIDETNGIVDLVNNQKIDPKYMQYMFRSYGLEIFNGLPEVFLRNLVPRINDLFARKGSVSVIEYMSNLVAGVSITLDMSKSNNYHLNLRLDMDSQVQENFPDIDQLKRIVAEFVPFFWDVDIVFYYVFSDKFSIRMKDYGEFDSVNQTVDEPIDVTMEDTLLDDVLQPVQGEESTVLPNESYKEDTCFLNVSYCTLNDNFHLNSLSGYDIITINGISKERTYAKEV